MEGQRSRYNASVLVQVYDEKQAMGLGQLEGSWMQLSRPIAGYAYAWALANIEYIVQVGGMGDLERILNRIAEGSSAESSVQEVLRNDYDELAQATVAYLHKTYF